MQASKLLSHACLGTCVFCVTSLLALEGAADRSPPWTLRPEPRAAWPRPHVLRQVKSRSSSM